MGTLWFDREFYIEYALTRFSVGDLECRFCHYKDYFSTEDERMWRYLDRSAIRRWAQRSEP